MERDVVMVGNVPTERLRWAPRQAAADGAIRTFVLIPGIAVAGGSGRRRRPTLTPCQVWW